ncbi:hypothetical protein b23_0122 [Synechococcus phage B23]|nr:hypothetical protein b23_0122 [Synechococcus phage B23]
MSNETPMTTDTNSSDNRPDWKLLCYDLLEALYQSQHPAYSYPSFILNRMQDARDALLSDSLYEGPSDEEIIAFWSEHCAGDGDAGILRLARHNTHKQTH